MDTHFPNYARQTVPVSITELENAIAAALTDEIEACAKVADKLGDGYEVNYESRQDGYSEHYYRCAAAIRQRKGARHGD